MMIPSGQGWVTGGETEGRVGGFIGHGGGPIDSLRPE